ncbi:lysophospholipid acyltransferase family protein [Castellaniella sp. S9]|uniref:lysophospholipid acyltransferase family protein n=1 Tax=Castellaniella sp. S9 TaxID=2993652 RepID=UPI0022B3A5E9|nr:lysophospholipid acyltransferase family protein [Castellaniella sp. S9]
MLSFFVRLLAALPLGMLQAIGRALGLLVYAFPGRYRRRLRNNARQAGYADAAFTRRAAAESGAMVLEIPKVWWRTRECLAITGSGEEAIVRAALAEGRGIIYLTPHLGCFEITARHLTQYGPLTVMYRPSRSPLLDPIVESARDMHNLRAVPANRHGVREFVRALRRGEAVGMLPDQVPREGDGVWLPVFGRPALTMTLAARLALQTGVAVILTAGERLPGARGWRMHYLRLPEPLADTPEAVAAAINQAMETLIRRFPEQYLWSYNRYKQPEDAPPIPGESA